MQTRVANQGEASSAADNGNHPVEDSDGERHKVRGKVGTMTVSSKYLIHGHSMSTKLTRMGGAGMSYHMLSPTVQYVFKRIDEGLKFHVGS